MPRNRKKKNSQKHQLRLLAWLIALGAAIGSWGLAGTRAGLVLEITAATLFAVGAVWPHMFRGLYSPLNRLARVWFLS